MWIAVLSAGFVTPLMIWNWRRMGTGIGSWFGMLPIL
jgi:hypothetical protein